MPSLTTWKRDFAVSLYNSFAQYLGNTSEVLRVLLKYVYDRCKPVRVGDIAEIITFIDMPDRNSLNRNYWRMYCIKSPFTQNLELLRNFTRRREIELQHHHPEYRVWIKRATQYNIPEKNTDFAALSQLKHRAKDRAYTIQVFDGMCSDPPFCNFRYHLEYQEPGEWWSILNNGLDRIYDDLNENVTEITFNTGIYGGNAHTITFDFPVTEAEAIIAAEKYLYEETDSEYMRKHLDDLPHTFAEMHAEPELFEEYAASFKYMFLGDQRLIKRVFIVNGRLTLGMGKWDPDEFLCT